MSYTACASLSLSSSSFFLCRSFAILFISFHNIVVVHACCCCLLSMSLSLSSSLLFRFYFIWWCVQVTLMQYICKVGINTMFATCIRFLVCSSCLGITQYIVIDGLIIIPIQQRNNNTWTNIHKHTEILTSYLQPVFIWPIYANSQKDFYSLKTVDQNTSTLRNLECIFFAVPFDSIHTLENCNGIFLNDLANTITQIVV